MFCSTASFRFRETMAYGQSGFKIVTPAGKTLLVIPMHYGTFPALTGTPEAFGEELKKRSVKTKLRVMNVAETITV